MKFADGIILRPGEIRFQLSIRDIFLLFNNICYPSHGDPVGYLKIWAIRQDAARAQHPAERGLCPQDPVQRTLRADERSGIPSLRDGRKYFQQRPCNSIVQ